MSIAISFILIMNFCALSVVSVYAHNYMLDVYYDDCIDEMYNDGLDETWYILNKTSTCYHYSHDTITIKYYFEEYSEDGTYTWTTDVSASVANDIKTAYANSMKKWNNIYFYSYDSNGNIIKNKIIDIVEGTADDHNISIYPVGDDTTTMATTTAVSGVETIEIGNVFHRHYSEWKMNVYVCNYYIHDRFSSSYVGVCKEIAGAHEFGHVLGLIDVDTYCSASTSDPLNQHHYELIMGYGISISDRTRNIGYKDIAGAAITRGFHTDNDHKWLNCGVQNNGKYKLICSICNGVKEVSSLSGYVCDTYLSCGGNHNVSSGNMMAVASYGSQDYYKCKYCRYVAPFSSIVSQNYSIVSSYSSYTHHKYVNNVSGLNYTFLEAHNYVNNVCTTCGFSHTHSYGAYLYYDNFNHIGRCACGMTQTFVTANGSYILPSGIVVLEDADIEAYINGTLQFYNRNDNAVAE